MEYFLLVLGSVLIGVLLGLYIAARVAMSDSHGPVEHYSRAHSKTGREE